MVENAKGCGCGQCGATTFKIYTELPSTQFMKIMYIECTGCNSVTVLRPETPRIAIDWNKSKGDGTLAIIPT